MTGELLIYQSCSGLVAHRTYSGSELIQALDKWGFEKVGQSGSHVKLCYHHPVTNERRTVIVPLHDELATGTLHSIAYQAGAKDPQKFVEAIREMI